MSTVQNAVTAEAGNSSATIRARVGGLPPISGPALKLEFGAV